MALNRALRCIGRSGERYLARTRAEQVSAVAKSGGAGALTALTVVVKALISALKFTLLAEAFLGFLNYAVSFLMMQGLGFRLATKQPALLAVVLSRGKASLASVSGSQILAAIGNLAFVIAGALVFHLVYGFAQGESFLPSESAVRLIGMLDPLKSDTVPLAAFTGFLLWMASMTSGFAAHWARRVRLGLAYRSTRGGFLRRTSRWIGAQAQGLSFNLTLALLLGAIPWIGKVTGTALDVRHFTLSGGVLALATFTLGWQNACDAGLFHAALGVVMIGGLNFTVSFLLSFLTAEVAKQWYSVASDRSTGVSSRA